MCELSKKGLISCQLSFYPLGKESYIEDIDVVLDIIKGSRLDYTIGEMSTVLIGESEGIFAMLKAISDTMTAKGCKYAMTVTLSNVCGIA